MIMDQKIAIMASTWDLRDWREVAKKRKGWKKR